MTGGESNKLGPNASPEFESRLRIYRGVWIAAIVVVLMVRFTFFFHSTQNERFPVFLVFMLSTWIPLMLLNGFESQKLRSYFFAHYGTGSFFRPKFVTWYFSRNDYGDPQLAAFRAERNRFARFMFTVFFAYPVIAIIVAM